MSSFSSQIYFNGLIQKYVLTKSHKTFDKLDRSTLRTLKYNLQRNPELLEKVNQELISIEQLIALPIEDLANDEIQSKRKQEKSENLKTAIKPLNRLTKDEMNQLINKIEDP